MAEKTRYSDEELQEFKELILQKYYNLKYLNGIQQLETWY